VLLTARRLFDGRNPVALADQVVEIEDGVIRGVRRLSPTDVPDTDLGDVTLLPGLVDAHQHLVLDASDDPVTSLQGLDDDDLLIRMQHAALGALTAGITTIRDLGDRGCLGVALRERFRRGDVVGPRVLAAGPPLTIKGGHCWFLGGEVEGIDGIRAAIQERAAHGVDVVKLMATGGNLTPSLGPHESQFTREEIGAATYEAHAFGLPIAVHAHGERGIADARAAGVDSIEHCTFFTADGVSADRQLLDDLARSGVAISLTAALKPGIAPAFPAMMARVEAIIANVAILHAAGARLLFSSDAGVGPNKPHDVLPYGVSGFAGRIGMSNAEALASVTILPAEACGLGDVVGTIEPGKDADLLAVAGDPLTDLGAIHDVAAVFSRGRRVALSTPG
jgi:imidazolonepropionase-like amidohydrolase